MWSQLWMQPDQCGHYIATSNISLSALEEKWVGGGEGSKSRGPTKSTICFTDEESLGWATVSPQHRRNQASFRKWKSQRGSHAVILFIYFSLNCLPERQITPVSDSTVKLCIFHWVLQRRVQVSDVIYVDTNDTQIRLPSVIHLWNTSNIPSHGRESRRRAPERSRRHQTSMFTAISRACWGLLWE